MSYENEFEKEFDKLLETRDYHSTLALLRSEQYKGRVRLRCSDAVQACWKHLTDENYEGNLDLYCCCEEFLKYVAEVGPPDEVLMELLEIIETCRSDNVFTSALKALQICLQHQRQDRVNGLEWSLNSVHSFVTEIQLPTVLQRNCDEKQERLLEQDPLVQRLLMNFITITMFLEPLVEAAIKETKSTKNIFKDTSRNRSNILAGFILQLLGSQLSLLDLSNREDASTNANSLLCGKTLSGMLCQLLGDPFFLLSYAEGKVRWKRRRVREEEGVYEHSSKDVFMLEEKASLTSLGVFYYLLLSEGLVPPDAPKVYFPLYTFQMCLYLVNHLICCEETALQYKGVRLGLKVVHRLKGREIPSASLDLKIHQDFCESLCKLIVFSAADRSRKQGLQLLKEYILRFDEAGQFHLLQNLIGTVQHNGLKGYLIGMYKNSIAESIDAKNLQTEHFRNNEFKNFLLQTVCSLPQKVETDLAEHSEQILAALNVVRYLAIRDKENYLGFWDFLPELEGSFLLPLRTAIDLSRAHFKAEQQSVVASKDEECKLAEGIDVSLPTGEHLPAVTKQHKFKVLEGALLTFDLMDSLLARVHECIEANCRACYSTRPPPSPAAILIAVNKCSRFLDKREASRTYDVWKQPSYKETIHLICSHKPQRYLFTSSTNAGSNDSIAKGAGHLDDFRAREEAKEEEFQKQQQQQQKDESQQEESSQKEELIRAKILEAALPFVSMHGWSKKSLALGAESAGYPSVAHGMFPNGGIDLIRFFYGRCNDELVAYLKEKTKNGDEKVTDPVEFAVEATKMRLQMLEPYISYWPQAIAIMSLPQNVPTSLAQLLTLVDDICYYCGDRSVDFKWYVRRVGLATIFKMTEMFMLQDSSIDHQETWRFLRHRMEEASYVQGIFDQSEEITQNMQKGFASVFTTARNIIGLGYNKR